MENKKIVLIPGWLNSGGMYCGKNSLYAILDIWKNQITPAYKVEADYLIAHSLGCNWALENWSLHKNTKIILVNPLLPKRSLLIWLFKYLDFFINETFPAEKEIVKGLRKKLFGAKECIRLLKKDFNDTLNRIPTEQITIICGEKDTFYCDKKFKEYIFSKNIKLIEIKDSGHDWNEKFDNEIRKIIFVD